MIEIINGAFGLSIQDYPGRVGYWNVGIPPAGPMDALAFRIANRSVGNADKDAGIELTAMGATFLFHNDATIAFGGAEFAATVDKEPVPWWTPIHVQKGSTVKLGKIIGYGFRAYMAVRGGIDVPGYLGSRSTFANGHFGGFEGRNLKKGDMLNVFSADALPVKRGDLTVNCVPKYTDHWEIGVLPGPHSVPDFFTEASADIFYSSEYKVSIKTSRLGVRLEGPKPEYARPDGGEGGNHPSNMIDYAYAVGTINFSGDTPIIIGVDGPSLGGFISFCTLPTSQLWKVGQLKPGDMVHFYKMTLEEAENEQKRIETILSLI